MTNQQNALQAIEKLKSTLISVATGGPRLDEVKGEYTYQYQVATDHLSALGLTIELPYPDIWEWYGRWSQGDLPSYQSRRDFISNLFKPIVSRITGTGIREPEVTGWDRVDRGVAKAHQVLRGATHHEDYQSTGHLCREVLISLAQQVWAPERHPVIDVEVSPTDAKRMLERFPISLHHSLRR